MKRIGSGFAGFVGGADDGRRVRIHLPGSLEFFDLLCRVHPCWINPPQAQGALDGDFPVAKGRVIENLGLLRFLEGEEGVHDALDVGPGEFAVLLPQVLAQRGIPLGRVDKLHLAPAMCCLRLVSTQM